MKNISEHVFDSDTIKNGVSIHCIAYNHEKYIKKCLDGFLMQKTNFPVEIIINDDASTDKTAEIIKSYEEKYPHIFRPFYQSENKYSTQRGYISRLLMSETRGKYIAKCEGDDYWTDPLKLQKQFEALEKQENAVICTHDYLIHYEHIDKQDIIASEKFTYLTDDKISNSGYYKITINEFIKHLDGLHTATNFFRTDKLKEVYAEIKSFVMSGDYMIKLLLLQKGYCVYIPDQMSVLRKNAGGLTQQKRTHLQNFKIQEKQIPILIEFSPEPLKKFFYKRLWKIYPNYILGRKGISKDVKIVDRLKAIKPFLVALFKSL